MARTQLQLDRQKWHFLPSILLRLYKRDYIMIYVVYACVYIMCVCACPYTYVHWVPGREYSIVYKLCKSFKSLVKISINSKTKLQ